MLGQFLYGVKYVLGLDKAGRNLRVYPDDTFVVSYPKSGNTWSRFLIANLSNPGEPATFANINRLIPDPEALSKRSLKKLPRPRILKSHEAFDPRYKKVIYIVRDPRDVVLSEYHFDIKRQLIPEGTPVEERVKLFLEGGTCPYGSWGENVASWLYAREHNPRFLLVRYEDLEADTTRELARLAAFLGIEPTPERLTSAVERSTADQMRKLEKAQAHLWSSTKETRKDKPFVRAAKSGGWRKELPESSLSEIESAWGPLMKKLGYELYVQKSVTAGVEVLDK
ncbi:MAG: sulfotransferase domain-containing protein [Terriglobia bacterium]|jgi:hypothetical protein